MFIITGDHGMRGDGNHGGGTVEERETLVVAYYKEKEKEIVGQGERGESLKDRVKGFKDRVKGFEEGFVNQVDLTPTIAVLLGVPVPVNSIGYPVVEMLPERYGPYLNRIAYNTL